MSNNNHTGGTEESQRNLMMSSLSAVLIQTRPSTYSAPIYIRPRSSYCPLHTSDERLHFAFLLNSETVVVFLVQARRRWISSTLWRPQLSGAKGAVLCCYSLWMYIRYIRSRIFLFFSRVTSPPPSRWGIKSWTCKTGAQEPKEPRSCQPAKSRRESTCV